MRFSAIICMLCILVACTQNRNDLATNVEAVALEPASDLSGLKRAQATGGGADASRALGAVLNTLQQDPATLSARLQVQQSINAAARQGSWVRPSVSIDATQFVGEDIGASLQISQPLFDFGKRAALQLENLAEAGQRDVGLRQVQASLAQRMLEAAVDAQEARALGRLNQRRIAAFGEALDRANRLSNLNLVTASDLRLTEVRLNGARKDLATSNIALNRAERQWRQLSGTTAAMPTGTLFPEITKRFGLTNAAASAAKARLHNLSLAAARAEQNIAQNSLENIDVAKRPTINAVSTTRLGAGPGKRTNLGLTVDFPIFSQDQSDAANEAVEGVNIQSARVTQISRDLGFRVNDTWAEISDLKRLAALERNSIQGLEARYRTLLQQINTGLTSFDKVIEAQSELFDTEEAALTNRYNADRAAIALLALTGVITAP